MTLANRRRENCSRSQRPVASGAAISASLNIYGSIEEGIMSGVQMQWNVRIPLREGICLSAILYMPPEHAWPVPAIVTMTPYMAQTYHDRGLYFASQGYLFLSVDVRGRGNSEGIFDPNINEARDGYDVIEWIAQQAACSGQVAMWGGSYAGYAQWSAAKEFPPHLNAIAPAASPCFGVDFPIRNNIGSPYWMQWLTLVAGRALQDRIFSASRFWADRFRQWFERGLPFKDLDEWVGQPSAVFQRWAAHPRPDAFWEQYSVTSEQYAKLSMPVLTITGICDGGQLGALTHYRNHLRNCSAQAAARHYLIIGPWDHAGTRTPMAEFCGIKVGPASLVDLNELHRQWYDWTLRGGDKPEFLRKNVAYYVLGAERWQYADTLNAVTARVVPLYFDSTTNPTDVFNSGSLTGACSRSSGPDQYQYDPRDVRLAELESELDPENRMEHRLVYGRAGHQLVYHSEPLASDTEISGFFRLTLWLAIDQPDTDFSARVYEVGDDGSAMLLTGDWKRARYRQGLREEQLITSGEPLLYDFDTFDFVAKVIKRGHRLRLVLGAIDSIYAQKNYNSGGAVAEESRDVARKVTVKLFHDDAFCSSLHVPLGVSTPEAMTSKQ